MSQQSDAFIRQAFTVDLQPLTFDERLRYGLGAAGSGRALARQLGVGETTIRRWRSGTTTPKPGTLSKLDTYIRGLRTRQKWPEGRFEMALTTAERYRPTRERIVKERQLQLAPGTLDQVRRIWVTSGDSDAAYAAFLAGIQEPWYRDQLGAAYKRHVGEDVDVDLDVEPLESDYDMSVN